MKTIEGTRKAIKEAAEAFSAFVDGPQACPACGSADIQDNGCAPTDHDFSARCLACDEITEPNA